MVWKLFKKTQNNKVNFIIIGAQKAGTTTLFDILSQISLFSHSSRKEIGFFGNDSFYLKGNEFYHSFFSMDSKIKFEATPNYLYYDFVPERIFNYNKDMKFIVLLRNPVDRCYSAWNMFRSFNLNNPQEIYDAFVVPANDSIRDSMSRLLFTKEFPSFLSSVQMELDGIVNGSNLLEPSFVRRGLYVFQIERYLQFFKKEQFLFIEQSELLKLPEVLSRICKFLEVDFTDIELPQLSSSNIGSYDKLSFEDNEAFSILQNFYLPYNCKLFDLLGRRYNWND